MAILLDLAHELLLQILESLAPIEMVSFATSCKRIHTVAQDNLTLHRQRIERYQNITLWGCFCHQDQPHPILLLRDICRDWRVAYYARSLVVECGGKTLDLMNTYWPVFPQAFFAQETETVKSVLPEITIPVRKMLRMALRWDEAKINDALHTTEHGTRGAILGLLIVSLPAIKSISFKDYVWHDELWRDSLKSITYQLNPYVTSSEVNFLMDVSELNLDNRKGRPSRGMLCSVVPFVTLPSLRVIRGNSIYSDSYSDYAYNGYYPLPPSPVTEIDLQSSTLDAVRLHEMLRYTTALKRFRYDRGGQPDISDGAQPGSIIDVLLACASHSLESLALTGATAYRSLRDINIDDTEGSLKDFQVLKDIHLPGYFFLTYKDGRKIGPQRRSEFESKDIPRLVDVLPASIETVRLHGEMSWEAVAALLIGLPEGKVECLPKLKEVLFTITRGEGKALLAHLRQKQGIVLQLDKVVETAPHCSGRIVF